MGDKITSVQEITSAQGMVTPVQGLRGAVFLLECENMRISSLDDVRAYLSIMNLNFSSLTKEQMHSCVEFSMKVIEARPYHFALQEALDLLGQSIGANVLPSKQQLGRFIEANLLDEKDYAWQFGRSRAVNVFKNLIYKAPDAVYATSAACALIRQSSKVTINRDRLDLAKTMEGLAKGWPHASHARVTPIFINASSELRKKAAH